MYKFLYPDLRLTPPPPLTSPLPIGCTYAYWVTDHPEVALILGKLHDIMRARDAVSICHSTNSHSSSDRVIISSHHVSSPANSNNNTGGGGPPSSYNPLTASRRNGMSPSSWWEFDSVTSAGGSSLFGSVPNSRGRNGFFASGGSGRGPKPRISPHSFGSGNGDGNAAAAAAGGEGRSIHRGGSGFGSFSGRSSGGGGGGGGRGGSGIRRHRSGGGGGGGGLAGIGKDGAIPEEDVGRVSSEAGGQPPAGGERVDSAGRPSSRRDDGMQGGIRIGTRFASAPSMRRRRSGGGSAYRRGHLASFFEMYSKGNNRHR